MKKIIAIIIILLIIFVSLLVHRNMENESSIKIEEVNKIEEYIKKIYNWKEISDEALPTFDDINNANEKWLWGNVRTNIDEYEVEYEKIENITKDLYGENLNKKYPKEGNEFIVFNAVNNKYELNELTLDAQKDSFLIKNIEKDNNNYKVDIIEYLVDYSNADSGKISVENLKGEKIYELIQEEASDGNIGKLVKDNIDKFSTKTIILEKKDNNIYVIKVEH